MKSNFLFVLVCFSLLFSFNLTKAQDVAEESPLTISAEFVSSYVWRGMYSDGSQQPNFQPFVSYSIGNFYVGSFMSTNLSGQYRELDFSAGYAFGDFKVNVYDYFWGSNSYFDYSSDSTQHLIEAELVYQPEAFPLRFSAGSMVYGGDKKAAFDTTEVDKNKNNFSTYLELGYTFDLKGNSLYAFVGATPMVGLYSTTKAGIINFGCTASKTVEVTKTFSLPVRTSISFNPIAKNFFCFVGITI